MGTCNTQLLGSGVATIMTAAVSLKIELFFYVMIARQKDSTQNTFWGLIKITLNVFIH